MRRFGPHEKRAQHRGQRQGDHHRDQNGRRYRDGEFAEQPADDAAHQKQRNENGDQRKTDGDDREADLARAFQRRLAGGRALLDMAVDVLDDHDRVIHHEADRDREPHQREIVEAVA
ncbi:MAG TPA: hypothetical protein VJ454_11685 [Steroidobacteraceae bacterium]|nr:hypothetical protein [Steroidobacteraceae bacterium]